MKSSAAGAASVIGLPCVPKKMKAIPGATFWMGSDDFYPEEQPSRRVTVEGFSIDTHPVTWGDFRKFVEDTGYVTTAERAPDPRQYPDADPSLLVPGSLVFTPTPVPVPLDDVRRWWAYVPGANWRTPYGDSPVKRLSARHPVTQVSWFDARAYADWIGKDLPTEAEWEWAARGGLDRQPYAWGGELNPNGRLMANTWQGIFPQYRNRPGERGFGTTPVGKFAANGFGLKDMIGNVWEWTLDRYADKFMTAEVTPDDSSCCCPSNRSVTQQICGNGSSEADVHRVIKGGSFLCAPNYCQRYRPAARQSNTPDTSTCHIGFRCVIR